MREKINKIVKKAISSIPQRTKNKIKKVVYNYVARKVKTAVPNVVKAVNRNVNKAIKRTKRVIVNKVKTAIPKMINAANYYSKKVIKNAKRVVNKVRTAVPKLINKTKNKINRVVKKVKATIPKAVKSTKIKICKKIVKTELMLRKIEKSIPKQLREDYSYMLYGLERGCLINEAVQFATKWPYRLADGMFKKRDKLIEKYPILDISTKLKKKAWNSIKTGFSRGFKGYGNLVNKLNIPLVSDYVGAATGVSKGKNNIASTCGAFVHGVVVKGLGGTVDGLASIVVDPIETLEGINSLIAYTDEIAPKVKDEVQEYVDKKLINGSAEDRAEFGGIVAFEVASWLVGAGEAKAGATAGKAAATASLYDDFAIASTKATSLLDEAGGFSDELLEISGKYSKTSSKLAGASDETAKIVDEGVHIKLGVDDIKPKTTKPDISVSKGGKSSIYSGEEWYNYYSEMYGKENIQSTFIKEVKYQPSSGVKLHGTSGKTTTVLGRYDMDTKAIFKETGDIKSLSYDGHKVA